MKFLPDERKAPGLAALLVATAWLAMPPAVAAQRDGEGVIEAGIDCWDTECGQTRFSFCVAPIPPDFFGPGSEPFRGEVFFRGKSGTQFDTQVERLGDMFLPEVGSVAAVDIEIVELDLVSCQPIEVDIGGDPSQWDVVVFPSNRRPPPGLLTATRTHAEGGTFESDLFVQPVFEFTRVGDPSEVRVIDTGRLGIPSDQLKILGAVPWVFEPDPALGVNACSPGFAPGIGLVPRGPNKGEQCCEITCHSGATATHCIEIDRNCSGCPQGACCFGGKGRCKVFKATRTKTAEERCARKRNSVYHGDGSSCADTDGDRLPDVREGNNCFGTQTPCNLLSSPTLADTDGDGASDRRELRQGTNPCDPNSTP